jgi:hypothetical protein
LLNGLRIPVKIAQEQLGHADISTTLNIYTHVVDALHRQAIEALERQLFPTVPKSQRGPFGKGGQRRRWDQLDLEAPPGFEPGMEVLQI